MLEWDPDYEVPSTPRPDAERAYHLTLNHISGEPLIAWLKTGAGQSVLNTTSGSFNLTSVAKTVFQGGAVSADTWLSSGGQLCQYSPNQPFQVSITLCLPA